MAELGQNDIDQKQKQVVIISQESFYYPLSSDNETRASRGQYNFDHPSRFIIIVVVQDALKHVCMGLKFKCKVLSLKMCT